MISYTQHGYSNQFSQSRFIFQIKNAGFSPAFFYRSAISIGIEYKLALDASQEFPVLSLTLSDRCTLYRSHKTV